MAQGKFIDLVALIKVGFREVGERDRSSGLSVRGRVGRSTSQEYGEMEEAITIATATVMCRLIDGWRTRAVTRMVDISL